MLNHPDNPRPAGPQDGPAVDRTAPYLKSQAVTAPVRQTGHVASGEWLRSLTIGARIRYLMEVREVSQTSLAPLIGVSQAAISNLVTDRSRKPSAKTLLRMADALGVAPGWILEGPRDGTGLDERPLDSKEILSIWVTLTAQSQTALLQVARILKYELVAQSSKHPLSPR
jgi:transcriptional regulator with XRE-family HTH domain